MGFGEAEDGCGQAEDGEEKGHPEDLGFGRLFPEVVVLMNVSWEAGGESRGRYLFLELERVDDSSKIVSLMPGHAKSLWQTHPQPETSS